MKTNPILIFLSLLIWSTDATGQQKFTDYLFYEVDDYQLSSDHTRTLDSLIQRYFAYQDYRLEIIGHADTKGSKEYNKEIAGRRAQEVKRYLQLGGIPNHKISIHSEGDDSPLDEAKLAAINGTDRRVEVVSYAEVFNHISDVLDILGPQMQTYTFDNAEDQLLTMQDGTEIFIPAHSLTYADGSGAVSSLVTLEVKEAFDVVDFLAEDLNTMTDKSLLQTGGMIYINAHSEGNQLGIVPGKLINIKYPQKRVDDGMMQYTAIESQGQVSWALTEGEIQLESKMPIEHYDLSCLLNHPPVHPERPHIVFDKMPKTPIIPATPTKPRKPQKPTSENTSEADLERMIVRYEKLMKIYEKRLKSYHELKMNYDTVMPKAKSDLRMWNMEVNDRMTRIESYQAALRDYYCDLKLQKALEYVHIHYGTVPEADLYVEFRRIVYTDLHIDDELDPYTLAFGPFAKQVLRSRQVKGDYLNYNSYSRRSKFNKVIKPLIDQIEQSKIASEMRNGIEGQSLDRYMFSVGNFGYHNVDKPIDLLPEEQMELVISDRDADTKYFVVLKDAQSVISPLRVAQSYQMGGLPRHQMIKIVGVKLVDALPQVAITEINASDEMVTIDMDFAPTDLNTLRAELQSLNSYAGI